MVEPDDGKQPVERPWLRFLIGLLAGLGANALVVVIGLLACGSQAGEFPPFVIFLMTLWVTQWAYLLPAMIVAAITRAWWVLLGLFAAGLATGLLSALLFGVMVANPSTV